MLIDAPQLEVGRVQKSEMFLQLAIFFLFYTLVAWATILPAKSAYGSSQSKFFNCERDEALLINGFFLIGLSNYAVFHYQRFPAHYVLWLFAVPISIMEWLFSAKNCLDKKWAIVFRIFLWVPLGIEIFL